MAGGMVVSEVALFRDEIWLFRTLTYALQVKSGPS